jgi:serralysin
MSVNEGANLCGINDFPHSLKKILQLGNVNYKIFSSNLPNQIIIDIMKNVFISGLTLTMCALLSLSISAQAQRCSTDESEVRQSQLGTFDTTKSRGVADNFFLWNVGDTVYVQFLNGSTPLQRQVMQYAKLWENHANINFVWTTGTGNIRIKFNAKGENNSLIGIVSNSKDLNEETMNLDSTNLTKFPTYFRTAVIHEFGHAIGFLHEHSNPKINVQWNRQAIYDYHAKNSGWSKEQVDWNIFKVHEMRYTNGLDYDSKSIMHYPIEAWETLNGYAQGWNNEISAGDIKMAALLYPKNGDRPNEVPRISVIDYSATVIKFDPKSKGINIHPSFFLRADGAIGDVYLIVLLFDKDGKPLPASGETYNISGTVGAYYHLRSSPGQALSVNKQDPESFTMFIPIDKIPKVPDNEIKVLFRVFASDGTDMKSIYDTNFVEFKIS